MIFIVRKEVVSSITSCTPISSRLISIQISARSHYIAVIRVYVPTSDHEDEEIEHFSEQLDHITTKTPEATEMPKWALTHTNTGQEHQEDLALERQVTEDRDSKSHRLTLANTLLPHEVTRTAIWHAPNGQVHNQMDFILTSQHFKSSIKKTMSFPDADIGRKIMTLCLQLLS